jgi:HAMP domain-containing protein
VTLTLTLLLAIFAAIASAFLIASDLAKPLLLLAEGTKAVAEGNLAAAHRATSDELGTLTQSFNTMTRQLLEARSGGKEPRRAGKRQGLPGIGAGQYVGRGDGAGRPVQHRQRQRVGARILGYDFSADIGSPCRPSKARRRSPRPSSAPSPNNWPSTAARPRATACTGSGSSSCHASRARRWKPRANRRQARP